MEEPIVGTEELASGRLTRGALRWNYTAILPDIYLRKGAPLDFFAKATAAWLWTGRKGILAGSTAAALQGGQTKDHAAPIELIAAPRRSQTGVVIRNERICSDEVDTSIWVPLTSPARTALDVARRLPLEDAVVALDQISAATGLSAADVAPLQERYRKARGMGSAYEAITLMDGGSRSPEETRLRLSLIEAGLPRPQTSIDLGDSLLGAVIGLGWPEAKVGVEWGPHRRGIVGDVRMRDLLNELGWQLIEHLPQHSLTSLIGRCRDALRKRWRNCGGDRSTG